MKISKITNLDLIKLMEAGTELFRNKTYYSREHVEKFLGLAVARSSFYGQRVGQSVISLNKIKTSFESSEDVTLQVEGVLILNSIPVNTGAGEIVYTGYGLLEVDGVIIYDGRSNVKLDTDDIENVSGVPGATVTEALDSLDDSIADINDNEFKVTYYESIDISATTSGSLTETPAGATIQENQFGESGNAILSTLTGAGIPTYETPLNGSGEAITANLDVNGNWLSSDLYGAPVALIYSITIHIGDWDNIDLTKVVDFHLVSTDSDKVLNKSTITGITVSDALETLDGQLSQIYDGYGTTAAIIALDPTLHVNETWWATDAKIAYKSTLNLSGANIWQPIGIIYDNLTDTYNLTTTQDGQVQNLGQEVFFLAYNNNGTGATSASPKVFMSTGSKVGSESFQDVIKVAASDIGEGRLFGLNTTSLQVGEYGKITTYGTLNNVDTSAWNVNDVLYVSPTTSGELTTTKPSINAYIVGKVLRSHATEGIIFVSTISSDRQDDAVIVTNRGRLYFTGDEVTPVATDYYLLGVEDEGTIATQTETALVPDNSIVALGQDHWTGPLPSDSQINAGLREGQVEFEVSTAGGNEKIYFELYLTNNVGVPIDSGRTSQVVGDLGVRPIFTMETSLLDADANDRFKEAVRGLNESDYPILVNQGLRIHILCEKIGTAGGSKTFTIYFGSDHDTHLELIVGINTDDVQNISGATGATQTEVNNNFNVDISNRITWLFPYTNGTYPKNTMTRHGEWATITNKETSDYPVPVSDNNPQWGVTPNPSWAINQLLGDVIVGFDTTALQMLDLKGWRFWATGEVGVTYTAVLYNITNSAAPELLTSIEIDDSNPAGWVQIFEDDVDAVLTALPGDKFRVAVVHHDETNDVLHNDIWRNLDGGAIPGAGVVTLNTSVSPKILIHDTSSASGTNTDRSTDLLTLKEDDRIRFEETSQSSRWSLYRIQGPAIDQGTYVEIPVELLDEGQSIRDNQDVKTDWTVYGAATNTDYVTVAGGIPTYFPDGDVQGFITQDFDEVSGPIGPSLSNNLFGIDFKTDTYTQSPDWDIVAFSGGTGGSSPGEELIYENGIKKEGSSIKQGAPIIEDTSFEGNNKNFDLGVFINRLGYVGVNAKDGVWINSVSEGNSYVELTSSGGPFSDVILNALPSVTGQQFCNIVSSAGANAAGDYFGIQHGANPGSVLFRAYDGSTGKSVIFVNGNPANGDKYLAVGLDSNDDGVITSGINGYNSGSLLGLYIAEQFGYGINYENRVVDEANVVWATDDNHIPSIGMIKDNASGGGSAEEVFIFEQQDWTGTSDYLHINAAFFWDGINYIPQHIGNDSITITKLELTMSKITAFGSGSIEMKIQTVTGKQFGSTPYTSQSPNRDVSGVGTHLSTQVFNASQSFNTNENNIGYTISGLNLVIAANSGLIPGIKFPASGGTLKAKIYFTRN